MFSRKRLLAPAQATRSHPEVLLAPLPAALGSGWYEEDLRGAGRKWACPSLPTICTGHIASVQPTAQTVSGFSLSPPLGAASSLTLNV